MTNAWAVGDRVEYKAFGRRIIGRITKTKDSVTMGPVVQIHSETSENHYWVPASDIKAI